MKIYGIWLSFKEAMNCSTSSCQVSLPTKGAHLEKLNPLASRIVREEEIPAVPNDEVPRTKPKTRRGDFSDLNIGDTTRNIVEMIFRSESKKTGDLAGKKIEKVLKVKNSSEIIERFEAHREMVKKAARGLQKRHPRSVADGNELLKFHATTMACCCSQTEKVTGLCRNQACGVCRIIRSGFASEEIKRKGIRLSALSVEDSAVTAKGGVKMAMVVCRVIAGMAGNGGGEEGNCDGDEFVSIRKGNGFGYDLLVKNGSAVLPCFVIVYS